MPKFFEEDEWTRELGCLECGELHFREGDIAGVCDECSTVQGFVGGYESATYDHGSWGDGWEESY